LIGSGRRGQGKEKERKRFFLEEGKRKLLLPLFLSLSQLLNSSLSLFPLSLAVLNGAKTKIKKGADTCLRLFVLNGLIGRKGRMKS
jgi:hypothetical protein